MNVTINSTLVGLSVIDFETHQFIKLYILQDIKGQDAVGQKTHPVKIYDLKQRYDIEKLLNQKVLLSGSMKSDDNGGQVFVAEKITKAS